MSWIIATISLFLGLYFLRYNVALSIILSIIYFVFIFVRFKPKKASIFLATFICGAIIGNLKPSYVSKTNEYKGVIVEAKENYYIFESHLVKFYVYEKDNLKEVGDILKIQASQKDLSFTTYECQFDFESYLNNKGVYHALEPDSIEEVFKTPFRFKSVEKNFLKNFDSEATYLVDAFLFNHKDYQSKTITTASNLGLTFLLSASGIYLHLFISILKKIFELKMSESKANLLAVLLLLPFSIFSFSKIGVVRVFIIQFLNLTVKKKWKMSHIVILTLSTYFLLLIDYNLAYQSSFYVGISISYYVLFIRNVLKGSKRKIQKILIPIFIYAFTFPISNFSGGEIHLFTYLFQITIIPLSSIFMSMCALCFYKIPLYKPINWFASTLGKYLNFLDKIDLSINFASFGSFFYFVFYIFLFIVIYLLENKRFKHAKLTGMTLASIMLIGVVPIKNNFINAVYFINVGQGDSILIQNKNNVVMIDTGGNKKFDMATETLVPFLKKKQIKHINALITTHDDFDHAGAVDSLIKNFKIYNYIHNKDEFPYSIGDILLENINTITTDDDNTNSLVLKMNFMNKKWLLMGDATNETEKFLIKNYNDLDCDILKIGHHGSNTSTSIDFLNVTTPSEAIISVGKNNYYKHPSYKVIERLEEKNIKIRRTDEEGTISYVSIAL